MSNTKMNSMALLPILALCFATGVFSGCGKGKDEVDNEVCQEHGDSVSEQDFSQTQRSDPEAAVGRGEHDQNHDIEKDENNIPLEPEISFGIIVCYQIQECACGC